MKNTIKCYKLTKQDIKIAHDKFVVYEPRDLFYRTAIELVGLAINKKTSLSIADALAVLLQTWNKMYYRYKRFDNKHFEDIESLIKKHLPKIIKLRKQSIENFNQKDECDIEKIFQGFENVLGPTGAAKCLHLLAPCYFPLWDRAIAKSYGFPLGKKGFNAENYLHFMEVQKKQSQFLGGYKKIKRNPLKAIDEYNYCKFTKRWI